MKKLFMLPVIALFFAFTGTDEGKSRESIAPYQIAETKADPRLKKSEAVFEISFFRDYSTKILDSIRLSYNGKGTTVNTDANGMASLNVKPGKYKFQFYYNSQYFEITTDSIAIQPGYRTKMNVYFESSIYPTISDKPVIYVYPEKTQAVDVKLELKGELAFTYPKYENGWSFIADPDGTIHQNGKEYDYLFWDGTSNLNLSTISFEEGFLVQRDSLVPFFEKHLSAMGLNPREIEDYITYWCPRMNANELNYIHFMFNEEYNEYASLTVNPKPDQLFRVYMIWGKADTTMNVKEQKTESFQRNGFTVVEWGGTEIPDLKKVLKSI